MKIKDKIILFVIISILFGSCIYLVRSVITPFLISFLIAYFLNPLVDNFCHKFKLSRLSATIAIVAVFFVFLIVTLALLLPIIYEQTSQLIVALPQYGRSLIMEIYPKIAEKLTEIGIKTEADLSKITNNYDAQAVIGFLQNFSLNLFSSAAAVLNILSLIFLMPILVFYLLKDWEILVTKINYYLPSKFALQIKKILAEIDAALSGYVRGQINVCVALGVLYSILLSFTGLNFAVLIGFLTGIFTFIPYVGALTGFVIAIIIALFQWGFDWLSIAPVAVIFLFCQTLESNYLTPKFVGKRVGLHPLWIIFGLFVFGALFGFVGVLIATPLTAVCGVLMRNLALEYKKRVS